MLDALLCLLIYAKENSSLKRVESIILTSYRIQLLSRFITSFWRGIIYVSIFISYL